MEQDNKQEEIIFESEIEERALKRAMEAYDDMVAHNFENTLTYEEVMRNLKEKMYGNEHNIKLREKWKHY